LVKLERPSWDVIAGPADEGFAETQPHNLGMRGWLDKVGSVGKTSRLRELFPSARESGDTSSDGSAVSTRLDMLGNVAEFGNSNVALGRAIQKIVKRPMRPAHLSCFFSR
jgi:hypothetical protein